MWRLIRKGFLSNHKVSPKPHALHQVLLPLGSSNISVQLVASSQSSSHFTTWVSKKPIFFPNLRRFSTVETPARAPPGSDIQLDRRLLSAESALDQYLNDPIYCVTLLDGDDVVEVDVEKLENVWSLLQSSGGAVDGSLIASLEGMGLVLSNKFLVRILERLLQKEKEKIPIENLIAFFRWCIEKPFRVKGETRKAIAWALCSELKQSIAYALKDLGEKESGLLNTKMLNKLIYLFYLMNSRRATFVVFNIFEEFGVADGDTYYYTILTVSRCQHDLAYLVAQRMLIAGTLPNPEKVGDIIFTLCEEHQLRAAYSVYMLAKAKNSSPPMDFVNFLINRLCYLPRKGKVKKKYHENIYLAFSMLEGFSGEDIKSMLEGSWKDAITNSFHRVIQALCQIGDVEKPKELLVKMIDAGMPPGEEIFSIGK